MGGSIRAPLCDAQGAGARCPAIGQRCSLRRRLAGRAAAQETPVARRGARVHSASGRQGARAAAQSTEHGLPSLARRLKARNQDTEATVAHRMARAAAEIEHWDEYDYVVVNADVDEALAEIK